MAHKKEVPITECPPLEMPPIVIGNVTDVMGRRPVEDFRLREGRKPEAFVTGYGTGGIR